MCKRNKLSECYPDISKQWHFKKNKELIPSSIDITKEEDVSKSVWWLCDVKHAWRGSIKKRIDNYENKTGRTECYLCERHLPKPFESLAFLNPVLASEWNVEKNETATPYHFKPTSTRIVWWICKECKYEWKAPIHQRNNGSKCSKCNQIALKHKSCQIEVKREDSLGFKYPNLAKQWHPKKNEGISPYEITPLSKIRVWWLCPVCDHEWPTIANSRIRGTGCPNCFLKRRGSFLNLNANHIMPNIKLEEEIKQIKGDTHD